jgi:hypothetical protein
MAIKPRRGAGLLGYTAPQHGKRRTTGSSAIRAAPRPPAARIEN